MSKKENNFANILILKNNYMAVENPKTDFNFSYSTLVTIGDTCVSNIEREAAIMLTYGVDEDYKDNLSTILEEVRNCPTDIEYLGNMKDLSEIMKVDAQNVRVAIRSVMSRVITVYPVNSGKWTRFGTKGMDELNEHDLAACGYRVARMATLFLTQLASTGITTAMLDSLEALSLKLYTSYHNHHDAELERIAATTERVELANKLYAIIVAVCGFGKDYWSSRNYAKYKAYVIYNTHDAKPNLSGKVGTASGTMLDAQTSEPTVHPEINLEYVDEAITPDAEGNWAATDVPIECEEYFAHADGHPLIHGPIAIQENQNTVLNILIEPGTTPPPPDN